MAAIGLAVVLGLVALIFVLSPLFRHLQGGEQDVIMVINPNEDDVVSSPEESEQAARVALQDVELDYQLGNIEEPDYLALREQQMQRALAAFKSRSEHKQKIDREIEAQVRRMRDNYEQANTNT
jgi:hypothetical protein